MAKSIPESKRSKFTGRGKGYSFLRLPHYVITSPEWRSLSGSAVKFLIELAAAYNGKNNGDLSLTGGQALRFGWKSTGTRDRAAQEATDAGFCVVTRPGTRMACTLYAITWEPIDDVGKGTTMPPERRASNRWRKSLPQNGVSLTPKQGKQS